ncbi:MAG TPA: sterol desaturase family protein [Dissulfurispiraceae bacterium]|nr:sterol desaturase family protein [Dissulfurispiraceae bacterium]
MISKEELYQTIVFVIVVIILDFAERRQPRIKVDRSYDLGLNIAALLVVIVAGELWKPALEMAFDALHMGSLLSVDWIRNLPGAARILMGLIAADFCLYWVHWGMHRKRVLWLTHAFHHSIDQLWWLSGSRTSVTHLLLFAAPQVLLGNYVFQLTALDAGIAFSIGIVVNVWIHTNISVDLGPLQWLLITPNYHRIHHGSRGLAGKNLGFVLTIWDRMFGTFADPRAIGDQFTLSSVSTRKGLFRLIAGV